MGIVWTVSGMTYKNGLSGTLTDLSMPSNEIVLKKYLESGNWLWSV